MASDPPAEAGVHFYLNGQFTYAAGPDPEEPGGDAVRVAWTESGDDPPADEPHVVG